MPSFFISPAMYARADGNEPLHMTQGRRAIDPRRRLVGTRDAGDGQERQGNEKPAVTAQRFTPTAPK
jgi:hypothetical protein